jgi:hypothetical protein
VDSNEIWVDAIAKGGNRVVGRDGGLGPHNEVDAWSHFVNVYMLDREGNRIDRRNPQDIFTPLYNHQIPPGAAQVVHYSFTVPSEAGDSVTFNVKLNYRKFDTIYMNYVFGSNYTKNGPFTVTNQLPIVTIAADQITFPVAGKPGVPPASPSTIPEWQRWNDYGIGLFLQGDLKGAINPLELASKAADADFSSVVETRLRALRRDLAEQQALAKNG